PQDDREEHRGEPRPPDRGLARVIVQAEDHGADQQEGNRDDLYGDERDAQDDDGRRDRDDRIRRRESADDARSAGLYRAEPEDRTEAPADRACGRQRDAERRQAIPAGSEDEPGGVDRRATERVQDEHAS